MVDTPARMRQLQATEAEWVAADPVLLDGEIAFSSDVMRYKVGPGTWSALEYWGSPDSPNDGHPYGIEDGNWVRTSRYVDFTGDLNTISTPGVTHMRLANPISNAWPDFNAVGGSFMTHQEYDADNAVQVGYAFNEVNKATHVMYQRVRRAGVWGTWYTNPGYSPVPATGDLDTLSADGTFELSMPIGNGVTNAWPNAGFGDVVRHTNIDSGTAMQVGYELRVAGQPQIWMRSMNAGVWSSWYENKFGFEVYEADIVDLNRVRWRNVWVGGTQYVKNDMVVSAGYLAVANTDTTESPVPVESGDPIYSLPTVPAWANQSHTGVVEAGAKYTVPASSLFSVTQYRFWVPTGAALPDYKYALYLTNITDPANPITSIIATFDGSQLVEGWNSFDNPDSTLLTEGTIFGVYLQSYNSASNSQWAAQWDRESNSNNGAPSTGMWRTNKGNSQIRFNVTDNGSNNQAANLALVTVGSDIAVFDTADGGVNIYQNYRVTGVTDNGTWFQFDVVPLDTGPGGAPTVGAATTGNFTIPVVGSTSYVAIADYYLSNPNIKGIISLSGGTVVEDEAAYCVDLQFQELIASPDWDIAAISAGGALGGGGGSGPGGGAAVWYGDTEPAEAVVGDLWYRSADPTGLFLKTDDGDSEQWVQTNGINIAGDFVERGGDTMTGNLLVPEAVADTHVPTFGQVKGEITASIGNYLPLAGGTLTGGLTVQSDLVAENITATPDILINNDGVKNENGIVFNRSPDQSGNFGAYLFWSQNNNTVKLNLYDESGIYVSSPLEISYGSVFLNENVVHNDHTFRINSPDGVNTHLYFSRNDVNRALIYQPQATGNNGALQFDFYDSAGTFQSTGKLYHEASRGQSQVEFESFYATSGLYYGSGPNFAAVLANTNSALGTYFNDVHYMGWSAPAGGPTGVQWAAANAANTVLGTCFADTWSDPRLKKNIRPTEADALGILNKVEIVGFDWNDKGKRRYGWRPKNSKEPDVTNGAKFERVEVGFTSTDMKKHIPSVVSEAGDPDAGHEVYENIDNKKLVPYLVRAVQQLTAKIEELEEKLNGN